MKTRKYLKVFVVILSFFMISMSTVNVSANQDISVFLDNEKIQFDVSPMIVNDRTMVPMRAIFEKLGAVVTWDDNTKTAHAYIDGEMRGVSITIGATYMTNAYMNSIQLEAPAMIENGRTLVPLRAITEAFGCDVQWDGDTRTINIYSENYIGLGQSLSEQSIIEVSNAEEFLNNIGSNRKIILTSEYYNLSGIENVNNTFIEKQGASLDGYIIKNVVNMTIEGAAEIVIDDRNADVLSFEKCKNITLKELTIGHTTSYDEYQCEGAVTLFTTCENVNLNKCNLYGCGAVGVYADGVKKLDVNSSKIYNCTYTGMWLTNNSEVTVNDTEFFDSIHTSGFIRVDNSTIICNNCNVHNIYCNDFGDFIDTFDFVGTSSIISFNNCRFSNNTFVQITNDETQNLTFNNCIFENNIGSMEHSAVVYNNSNIHNGTKEVIDVQASNQTSSEEIRTLFLKYVKLGVECDGDAIKCIKGYLNNFDERYKALFFENIQLAYDATLQAYNLSLEYDDLQSMSPDLQKVINVFENILNGSYTISELMDLLEPTTTYYTDVLDKYAVLFF